MERSKKAIGTYLPKTVYEALKKHSAKSGIPVTRIIEDAVKAYLKAAK